MLSMNNGIMSLRATRNIVSAYKSLSNSVRKLSSGLGIESARDDAAGLAVRQMLRADIVTVRQGSKNLSDGISMIQTAEGAAGAISDNFIRMKQLAAQAATGTYSAQQRNIMQQEFAGLAEQVTQIVDSTTFNGVTLHQDGQTLKIALGDGESISIDTQSISIGAADLTTDPEAAQAVVSTAIGQLSSYRGNLGASANRLKLASGVLNIKAESLMSAESRISDVDVAKEMTSMMNSRIRASAAVAAQSQSDVVAKTMMKLLFG